MTMAECEITRLDHGWIAIDWHPPFGPFIVISPANYWHLRDAIAELPDLPVEADSGR